MTPRIDCCLCKSRFGRSAGDLAWDPEDVAVGVGKSVVGQADELTIALVAKRSFGPALRQDRCAATAIPRRVAPRQRKESSGLHQRRVVRRGR
jgi:hypothetical protein